MRLISTGLILISLLLPNQTFGQRSYFTNTAPVRIHYSVYGEGKPVLLINGGPGYSCVHLRQVAEKLSSYGSIILFDQRGTGESRISEINSSTINLNRTLLDIECIRKDLKLDSWTVAGHSFGGLIAMAYAASYSAKVDKLVLISSAGPDLSFVSGFQNNIVNIIGKDTLHYQMPDTTSNESRFLNMVYVNAPAYVFDKSKTELVRKELVRREDFVYEVNALMFGDLFKNKFDISNALRSFKGKALIIQGAQDIVGMDTAFKIHGLLTESTLFFIPRCGHIPWLEQPSIFYGKVINFLDAP